MKTRGRLALATLTIAGLAMSATPAHAEIRNGRIAFQRLYNGYYEHVHTIRADGSGYQSPDYVNFDVESTDADFSPDGSMIAYISERDGSTDLWLMRPNGTVVRQLTNDAALESDPTWSPDGKKIAFVGSASGKDDIFIIRAVGGTPVNLTDRGTEFNNLDWAPDGVRILFDAFDGDDWELYSVRARAGIEAPPIRNLTNDTTSETDGSWSPDGTWIVFTLLADESGSGASQVWKLPVADPATRIALAAEVDGNDDATPVWSPDGTKIAYSHGTSSHPYAPDVWVMGADGQNPHQVAPDASFELDEVTSWQPRIVT